MKMEELRLSIKAKLEKLWATRFPEMTPAAQIPPARCEESFTVSQREQWLLDSHDYEEKMDGIRYYLHVNPRRCGYNVLTSRHQSKLNGFYVQKEDKVPQLRNHTFPAWLNDSLFDGEIYSTGLSSDTQHHMMTGDVTYHVWDVLFLGGRCVAHENSAQRRVRLEKLSLFFPPFMKLVERREDGNEFLEEILSRGGEGMVRKRRDAPYGVGWAKIKKADHQDVVIWGYHESKALSYAPKGWIQSVRVGQWLKTNRTALASLNAATCSSDGPVPGAVTLGRASGDFRIFVDCGQCSGMTEEMRAEFSSHQVKYIGSVIEIEYERRLKSGKFRNIRFNRLRADKGSLDCLFVPVKV
jgi:ATP-dependent DNA ligase